MILSFPILKNLSSQVTFMVERKVSSAAMFTFYTLDFSGRAHMSEEEERAEYQRMLQVIS